MSEPEVSAGVGALVLAIAQAAGADPRRIAELARFDPALGSDPDARIPLATEQTLWREAALLTSDTAFGLHAAERIKPGAFDVLDYAVRTAPTLRQSLERLVRYNRLVHDIAQWSLVPQGDALRVEHCFRPSDGLVQERHSAEFTIATVVTIGSQIAGAAVRPRGVGFQHAAPIDSQALQEHTRLFGVMPLFSQPVNFIELDVALVERANPSADPALSRVIERHAEALLASRPEKSVSAAGRVRQSLSRGLAEGQTTLSAVARQLGMSERSLQRRLADEHVTFDALLDEVRRELALHYLSDAKIAVAEIAYLLGYSEPSPFHRAFKRWTGKTPAEARKRAA